MFTNHDTIWGDDPDTRHSHYGYMIYLGGAPVCWRSKLHASVALSTAELEYIAACEYVKQVALVHSLLSFLQSPVAEPTVIYEHNMECVHMIRNKIVSGRNKHVELRAHFVRELHVTGQIKLVYMVTVDRYVNEDYSALMFDTFTTP